MRARCRAAERVIAATALASALVAAAPPDAPTPREDPVRQRIVKAARRRLGRPFRGDCSGYVLAVLGEARIAVRLQHARSRSESLHRASRPTQAPLPGDLAFFHDTYDRNHDGLANDRFTHVALVEEVHGATATLLHRGAHGIERIRIDPTHPSDPEANDPVRLLHRGENPRTRVLAGELFAGWGTIVPARAR